MAKVIYGPIVSDARNKVGATVFSKNKAGAFIRKKVSPTQPRTSKQTGVRANLSSLSKLWGGTLTDALRAGWVAFAITNPVSDVFGNSVLLSGLQMYIRVNQGLLEAGSPRIDTAPTDLSVPALTTITPAAAAGAATFTVAFAPTPVPGVTKLEIWATQQLGPGRNSFGGRYRLLQTFPAAQASPADIEAAYVARFGALVAGQKIGVGAVQINTAKGGRTQMMTAIATVAA